VKVLAVAAALAALIVFPAASAAQSSLEVRLTPRAGLVTPDGYFYVQYGRFGLGPIEWTEAALESAPVVGLSAEVELGGSGIWIRGEVLRALDASLSVAYVEAQEPVGFEPPQLARTYYDIPATLTIGSVDLAFPTRLTLPFGVQPYFTGGIGAKRYTFDRDAFGPIEDQDDDLVYPGDGTSALLNAGVGAVVRFGGLGLDVLVRDAISEYWGNQQHDVLFMLGLTWSVL
jgi:hypothetical protein